MASSPEGGSRAADTAVPADGGGRNDGSPSGFQVRLEVYSGPFDVLLGLIASKRLELTEVSLSEVTDEFLQYVRRLNGKTSADRISAFLQIASVLVETKSIRLLPGGVDPQDEESLEALEERDLLYARLLQYRAFKRAGRSFARMLRENSGLHPHHPQVPERISSALHGVRIGVEADGLAALAARALRSAPPRTVLLDQLHVPLADVREESVRMRERIRSLDGRPVDFATLVRDASSRSVVCARFLAVLLLFRARRIQFRQSDPFAPLELRWAPDGTQDHGESRMREAKEK